MFFTSVTHYRRHARTASAIIFFCVAAILSSRAQYQARAGVTPDSQEVQRLVENALRYLELHEDERLGGRCLIGLAFLKAGRGENLPVREAIEECIKEAEPNQNENRIEIYSNGLAIIFFLQGLPRKN